MSNEFEYEKKYYKLKDLVTKMLDAQQAYFKSNKDIQLLKKSKAIEQEVRELINPKQQAQSTLPFEFLAR